jgi:hypothetical protein
VDEYGISSSISFELATQLRVTFDHYNGDRNPHLEAKAIFGKTNRLGSSCSIYDPRIVPIPY